MTSVAILGATGSIGIQTLSVISQCRDVVEPSLLTCYQSLPKLEHLALPYPSVKLGIHGPLPGSLGKHNHQLLKNNAEIIDYLQSNPPDILVIAVNGIECYEVLKEVYPYIKKIAISSKEILILAGISGLLASIQAKTTLLPLDSEHVAIHQMIHKEKREEIRRVVLTASGGPFFRTDETIDLSRITPEIALKHPTWRMGQKVTIDSATLVNKGIELMEAKYLFNLNPSQLDFIIHPESIIHSFCEFIDGSVVSQMAYPNMELPIAYSLFFPDKKTIPSVKGFDFSDFPKITTRKIKTTSFPAVQLAKECMEKEGLLEVVYLIADDIAVELFLENKITFLDIVPFIQEKLSLHRPGMELTEENMITCYQEIKNKIIESGFRFRV